MKPLSLDEIEKLSDQDLSPISLKLLSQLQRLSLTARLYHAQVEKIEKLKEALEKTLYGYINLVNSGDCGDWNADEESFVIKARQALKECEECVK